MNVSSGKFFDVLTKTAAVRSTANKGQFSTGNSPFATNKTLGHAEGVGLSSVINTANSFGLSENPV